MALVFLGRSWNEWRNEGKKGKICVIDIGESRGRRETAAPLMVGRMQWVETDR